MRALHVPLIALLALTLGLFVACGGDGPAPQPAPDTPDPTEPADPTTPEGAETPFDPLALEDEQPAFQTAAQCGACHVEIYKEWKESYHGRAMSDPLFLEFSADINKEECIRCHAPVPLREGGFVTPIARTERREDAVSCLTCHQSGDRVAGPSQGLSGACRPMHDPDQTNVVKMCFVCHNQHNTGNEWLRGPYSPNASEPRAKPQKNCIDCHMEEVVRPIVKGGKPRKSRRHNWPGGHSLVQLRKAAELDVEVTKREEGGYRFRVWISNVGAGHAIPTDARHRSFDTYVKLTESNGTTILDPLDFTQQSKAHVGNYRLQYRNSGLKDTQVPPGERVSGLGQWSGYVDMPNAKSGKGEAWLVYRLTPRDVLDARSIPESNVSPHDPHDLGNTQVAVRVQKVEFTYGK